MKNSYGFVQLNEHLIRQTYNSYIQSIGVVIKISSKKMSRSLNGCVWGCPKSRIAPFAIVYFGKKYYLTVAKTKHYSNG